MELWRRLPQERREKIFGEGVPGTLVASMDDDERSRSIREYATRLNSMANKRLRRQEQTGLRTPSMNFVQDTGGDFRIGGLDDDDVVREIQRVERFLNMETSTVTGAKRYLRSIGERLGLEGSELDIQEYSAKVFSVTSKIDQYLKTAGYGHAIGSDELQQYVSNYIQSHDALDADIDDLVGMVAESDVYGTLRTSIDDDDFGIFGPNL